MSGCECSESWKGHKPAPIEVFHGEAMEQFHRGARFKVNETFINGIRFMNGIEVNVILADFKTKIMREYGITSDAIKLDEEAHEKA
jgi:hypothetical protein